jgi:hypothetical protein
MYEWVPCAGTSAEALERMRAHFPRPNEPMGEAWFISKERFFYTRLADEPVADVDADYLHNCLFEITSGTNSFGRREEWEQWFRFLLPDLILRGHERHSFTFLLEPTISAFKVIFWDGLEGEYAGFRDDVVGTLGRCLMREELWDCRATHGRPPLGRFLRWQDEAGAIGPAGWHAGETSAPLAASLFFCLNYLPAEEIPSWVASLAAVEDPYFRGALVVWLLGALDLLSEEHPSAARVEKSNPSVGWHNSFLLASGSGMEEPTNDPRNFLPRENRAAFIREVRRRVTPEVLLAWADSFSTEEALSGALLNAPELLFDRLLKHD